MRYLFFFVHPSKYYLFRKTINQLLRDGHNVEIAITSKDMLENLVQNEGWNYVNICPKGRKIKHIHSLASSFIYFFITLYRLWKLTRKKQYDLFITDDLLVYIGKYRNIQTIAFTDDDLNITKLNALVLSMATKILAPDITDIGRFNEKKISFPGYKELAYLHPNVFIPNRDIVRSFNPELKPYFILRLVSLKAYHDVGMKGLSNSQVLRLISLIEQYGMVFISAERELPKDFEKYRLTIDPSQIAQALYFAEMFIGDSQTMTSEAAILGTPAFRCNDFVGKISVMDEKENKYNLSFNYPPRQFEEMYKDIKEMLQKGHFKELFAHRREKMLQDKIDLSAFMIFLFENYKTINLKYIDYDRFKK